MSSVWYGLRLKRAGCDRCYSRGGLAANGTDLGSHGPSEEWSRIYCGVSVDTRIALGDGDTGPRHAERHGHAPTGPNVCVRSVRLSVSHRASECPILPSADVVDVVSGRRLGIHRHPIVCRHGSTPQTARGSLNPRASPIRGQATSLLSALRQRRHTSSSIHTTHGRYLRLTENHPRDLERSRYTPRGIRQQIRRT